MTRVDHVTRSTAASSRRALTRYLSEIGGHRLLDKEEEFAIARHAQDLLVLSNLRFVVKIASGFQGRGLPMEDLISEGNVGLLRAAERFDPSRGIKFITYAAYWIRKALRQSLAEQASPVRIPRYQMLKARRAAERRDGDATPGRDGSRIDSFRPGVAFLDNPVQIEGETLLAEMIRDERVEDPEETMVKSDLVSKLAASLDCLDDRERAVIVGRFGLSGSECHTLKQIGETFGLSRERIRQIEREARLKLRARLESIPRPGLHSA